MNYFRRLHANVRKIRDDLNAGMTEIMDDFNTDIREVMDVFADGREVTADLLAEIRGLIGGKWTSRLYFHNENGEEIKLTSDEMMVYFEEELRAGKEVIIGVEIRKHNLFKKAPPGFWHEFTIVKTINYYWSFEKNMKGIVVQRSKDRKGVCCNLGGQKRTMEDEAEGRDRGVSYEENILDVMKWIINRGALNNPYDALDSNCHFFASALYEAITRTKGRRLDNTV